jgi:mannose/cellobiose epimerase-like protein (N-acyl-D-glucosamine 2-epimerase family)
MNKNSKDDVIYLILQAEKDYHDAVEKAVAAAESYAGESREKQRLFQDGLKQEWKAFEQAETAKLTEMLAEAERKAEEESAQMKERLKACQEAHIETLSERLKKEVLTLDGNR